MNLRASLASFNTSQTSISRTTFQATSNGVLFVHGRLQTSGPNFKTQIYGIPRITFPFLAKFMKIIIESSIFIKYKWCKLVVITDYEERKQKELE